MYGIIKKKSKYGMYKIKQKKSKDWMYGIGKKILEIECMKWEFKSNT
jgi:hypothetical protein